jgi:NtrC-family two-component system response regulator AlgB
LAVARGREAEVVMATIVSSQASYPAGMSLRREESQDMHRPRSQAWSALVVDDDPGIRQSVRLCLEAAGGHVLGVGTATAAIDAVERATYDVMLLDLWLGADSGLSVLPEVLSRQPGIGIIVITAFATFESAVEAMRRGAADYLPKPFTPDQVRLAVQRVLESRRLQRRVSELEEQLAGVEAGACFDTHSAAYRAFLETARRAAASNAIVLLCGESGTGKNVLAQWIRAQSPRRDLPFATVHCPSLSSDLMSSVLFGHKRGAFTGAIADTPGKVQEAEGGTLFLDEVGDLSADAQARLLRFLNDRTYERLGEAQDRHADVRLIAATNRSLDELVRAGVFREDLLFRLNVVSLTVPPLRERPEDVPILAQHYLEFFAGRQGRADMRFSPEAVAVMARHTWPGNLRELRNAVERAVILTPSAVLSPVDLGFRLSRDATDIQVGSLVSLEEVEREHMASVIARMPTLDAAARVLGIDVTTLSRKRKRYGLV